MTVSLIPHIRDCRMVLKQIIKLGRGTLMAKAEVKHAYHNVPIHPQDRHLLGMQFDGQVYLDTTLPFGLRSAPKIFTAVVDTWKGYLGGGGELVNALSR